MRYVIMDSIKHASYLLSHQYTYTLFIVYISFIDSYVVIDYMSKASN